MPHSERKRTRHILFEKDATCFWCKNPIVREYGETKDDMATIEHILPVRLGGGDFERNLRLAHFRCNR